MTIRTMFICLITLLMGLPSTLVGQEQNRSWVIENVNVVDVVSGAVNENQTIVIADGKIQSVDSADRIKIPENANRVDAEGQFAIPGLWDMHIHWYDQNSMKLFPINGVAGVRLMWGSPMHHGWRGKFDSGEVLGPRLLIASAIIDGPDPIWRGSIVAEDAETGIKAVERAVDSKADFAKVYSLLGRDAYFEIAEEAKKRGLPFDGHVPYMVSVREASEAGQRTMEHLYGLQVACSSEENTLLEMQRNAVGDDGQVRAYFEQGELRAEIARRAIQSYDDETAEALFATLAENQTWQCPTLTVLRNITFLAEDEVQKNPHLDYIPKLYRKSIAPDPESMSRDEETVQRQRRQWELNLQILRAMHSAGVPVLAGTDCLNPFCLPGFSIHTELQLMVRAGLTPIEALRTATINPAKFMGREEELGSISAGKAADLVLLTANPLDSIENTMRIDSVFLRGAYHDRQSLDDMLEALKQ